MAVIRTHRMTVFWYTEIMLSPAQKKELGRWKNLDWPAVFPDDQLKTLSKKKIVIIGGCGRSGTTLLRVMLDSHSQIACGPESFLFLPTPIDPENLHFKFGIPKKIILSLAASADRWIFIEKFQTAYLSRTHKKIWADKTSRNVHRFDAILAHFPNARIIHMIRDPRDTVASLRTHRKRRVVAGRIVKNNWIMPYPDCINRWITSVSDGIKWRSDRRYIEIKYEDLVHAPDATLKKVCQHIGVRFEPAMLQFYLKKGISRDPLRFPQNVEATKPLSDTSVGRWKRDLPRVEVHRVTIQTARLARKLGYHL